MENPQKTILDPHKPKEAIDLIDFLTKDLVLSREHNNAFNIAVMTIRDVLNSKKGE